MDLTLSYNIDNVYARDSYVGAGSSIYSKVIEQVKYTVTGTHSDGRTASVTDVCTLSIQNTGYVGFTTFTSVTKSDLINVIKFDLGNSSQHNQNIADLEKAIRGQKIPSLSEITISS
tara:strand:- start:1868 stop:2218 length:351 start_codon:yes stop_codon:yes gene_type:complete